MWADTLGLATPLDSGTMLSLSHRSNGVSSPTVVSAREKLVYAVLGLLLLLLLFTSQRGLFTPDIKPEVYLNPILRLKLDLGTWLPNPSLGTSNYNMGLAPYDGLNAALHVAGVPPEAAPRIIRWVFYLLGAWGAVRLIRTLAPGADSPALRLTTAVVFVLNPYSVVAGSTAAILIPYTLFPWFLAATISTLRNRSWRSAAAAALLFAAMTGMNVGAVPLLQLAALPALVGWLLWRREITVRHALAGLTKLATLSVGVSLYWLLPSVFAAGAATTVIDNSETLTSVASTSSWSEVLRGLGLWPLYGQSISGPWQPGFVPYLADIAVILASFAVLVLAILGTVVTKLPVRTLILALFLVVGSVMVGMHPPEHPSPLGRLLLRAFEAFPSLLALRTTNKAGAGVALALTFGVALLVVWLSRRQLSGLMRATSLTMVAATVLLASQPVWAGQWFLGRWAIPDYWQRASNYLNTSQPGRLWFVPGEVLAHYTWSTSSVDDVNLSWFGNRESLVRTVLPTESPESTNLLFAIDNQLQNGRATGNSLSYMAALLGADQLLVRNDTNWEDYDGAAPDQVMAQVQADPGLSPIVAFGSPGENVDLPVTATEPAPSPLAVFAVPGAQPPTRALPEDATTVLVGDGLGIINTRSFGLLPAEPVLRYAYQLDRDQALALTGASHRWLLTDTNRRTEVASGHLRDAVGPLLTPEQIPASTRALGNEGDQTVAYYKGIDSLSASTYGVMGRGGLYGNPNYAVDGDPNTAWVAGVFADATGEWLELRFDQPQPLDVVQIQSLVTGESRISSFTIQADGQARTAVVRPDGTATTDFRGLTSDTLRITVGGEDNPGVSPVGISELRIDGVEIQRGARLPQTMSAIADLDGGAFADELATSPIDIMMTQSYDSIGLLDDQPVMLRAFSLPVNKTYQAHGFVRPTIPGTLPIQDERGCARIATLDGEPLWAAPLLGAVSATDPWPFTTCDPVFVSAGSHELAPVPETSINTVVWRDQLDPQVAEPSTTASAKVMSQSPTAMQIEVTNPDGEELYLASGMSVDQRWRASVAGESLGEPVTVNGHSMAWVTSRPGTYVVDLAFAPQTTAVVARWLSVAVVAIALYLAAFGRRRPDWACAPPAGRLPWLPNPWTVATLGTVWLWLTLGPRGALAGAVFGLLVGTRLLSAVTVTWLGITMLCAVPLAWIIGNTSVWGLVSPTLVLGNPLPAWLALGGLTIVTMGIALHAWDRRPVRSDTTTGREDVSVP